jgi:hypothetical protein
MEIGIWWLSDNGGRRPAGAIGWLAAFVQFWRPICRSLARLLIDPPSQGGRYGTQHFRDSVWAAQYFTTYLTLGRSSRFGVTGATAWGQYRGRCGCITRHAPSHPWKSPVASSAFQLLLGSAYYSYIQYSTFTSDIPLAVQVSSTNVLATSTSTPAS